MLASELRELKQTHGLALIGFSDEELEALLEDGDAPSGCDRRGPERASR